MRYPDFPIYCIITEEHALGRGSIRVAEELIEAGAKIIQYREKYKSRPEKYSDCAAIRRMTLKNGVFFIVNDDIDIALEVQADGIHIGQEDIPLVAARALVGDKFVIGVSTHSPEQAKNAVNDGADYIGAGPVFPTRTKKGVCGAVGLEYIDFAVQNLSIPFVAIGGIKLHNLGMVIEHGAKQIAMVTEIIGADNIGSKFAEILEVVKKSRRFPQFC